MIRVLLMAALLAAAGSADSAESVNLSDAQIKTVEKTVKARLKDPTSAVLSKPGAALTSNGSLMVCGTWNSKNAMGGYAGESTYMGRFDSYDDGNTYLASFDVVKMPEPGWESENLFALCINAGVRITLIGE